MQKIAKILNEELLRICCTEAERARQLRCGISSESAYGSDSGIQVKANSLNDSKGFP